MFNRKRKGLERRLATAEFQLTLARKAIAGCIKGRQELEAENAELRELARQNALVAIENDPQRMRDIENKAQEDAGRPPVRGAEEEVMPAGRDATLTFEFPDD